MAVTCSCTRQLQNSNIGWRFCERATKLMFWLKRDLVTSTNLQSEQCITMQGLQLWNKERAILETGKMKSPIGYQEIRLRAWESSERLLPRPWKTQGYPKKAIKRGIESLLKEHGLYSMLIKFQFMSVTNLCTKGMFEVYNRDQVVSFCS